MKPFSRLDVIFDYLFEDYGFAAVYCRDVDHGEHILIILQSPDCRIKFIYDRGTVEATIGTLSSPVGWTDCVDNTRYWFDLLTMIAFVEMWPSMTAAEKQQMADTVRSVTAEVFLSRKLQPAVGQVVALFREEVFKDRREEIEMFQNTYWHSP